MAGRSLFNGGGGGGGSSFNDVSVLQSSRDSIFMSGSSSSSFLGLGSMLSFQDNKGGKRSERPFFQTYDQEENDDDDLDEYFRQPEKKRRLTSDQVEFLEKSFELENKLEPERKIELAKELGLQPRQIAIWFQNRRARWKTKQLEKDYETMLASYDNLKADYDNLLKEKDKLKDEIASINEKLLDKEKGCGTLKSSNADNILTTTAPKEPHAEAFASNVLKQDELSSTKSYVFDSDSPLGVHSSSPLEPGDSSYVFEHDQSDLSQDEEDINISKNLLLSDYFYTKMEDARYSGPTNSSYLGFPNAPDDQAFNFW